MKKIQPYSVCGLCGMFFEFSRRKGIKDGRNETVV